MFDLSSSEKLFSVIGSALFTSYSPEIYLSNHTSKRNLLMQNALPDVLDLLVICAEAGLTLDAALTRVVREMGNSSPDLCDELNLTAIELGFLPERRVALKNLSGRVSLPAIKAVTATLIQSEKYGTPLAQSLRVLSEEFRNERFMKAEEKAAKLPAVMTIPLILFILPTLFVVLIGPASCQISDKFINGNIGG
jgi:tight adherence protein C